MRLFKTYLRTALLWGGVFLFWGNFIPQRAVAAPSAEGLRTGKLSNGLTYYVRHTNVEPGLAGFFLVQNVGSLMEEDNQQGLAHFLEHMAFNASQNFPGQIDKFLKDRNITHYNAYTAQDETIYNIDDVPTGDPAMVDTCLLILRDWCHFLTFPEKGIEKERGIVLEERRMRRDAVARAREQIVNELYNHSRYAARQAIGDVKVLETFGRDELVAYYDRWYRPDLQAVIAVGDFDAERVEKFIREHFSDIPEVKEPQPRPVYTITDKSEPSYVKVVDKELGGATMEFTQRFAKPAPASSPEELIRRITIRELFNKMIAGRLGKLTTGNDQTLYSTSVEYEELLRGYDALTISVTPYPGRDFRALSNVLTVWETARQLGFTPVEFEQQIRQMQRQAEGFEQNMDRIGYGVYATLYQNNYLNKTPIVEPAERGALMRKVLGELTLEDVNGWMKSWAGSDQNRVFIISGNDPSYEYLTLGDILGAEQDVREGDLEQPSFASDTARLIDFPLTPAKVVKERKLPVGDAVEWTFPNKAKVIFKRADAGLGRFRLEAFSEGGTSMLDDDDLPSADALESLSFASGVYKTDRSAMMDLMQSHDLDLTLKLQGRREVISGQALSKDADRFFEVLYLGLTHPRFDEPEFARYTNEMRISLETRQKTDLDRVVDTIKTLFSKPSPRSLEVDSSYIARIDLERVKAVFHDRFDNPGDFTFYLVGDLSESEAKEYAEKYIGTLPVGKGKKERYMKRPSLSRTESMNREFLAEMPDNKAIIELTFSNNLVMNRKQTTAFWLMGTILKSRLTDEIREKRGGSYNIDVSTRYAEKSLPRQTMSIHFETGADRADEMKAATYKELDDLLRDGVTERDVESIVTAQKQQLESREKNTGYWINVLYAYVEEGQDQTRPDYHNSVLDAMNPALVKQVANQFWKGARKVDIVVKSKPGATQTDNNTEK